MSLEAQLTAAGAEYFVTRWIAAVDGRNVEVADTDDRGNTRLTEAGKAWLGSGQAPAAKPSRTKKAAAAAAEGTEPPPATAEGTAPSGIGTAPPATGASAADLGDLLGDV
jgi:hypothetical protein